MDIRVKFCCFCIDLNIGVLIWGYLGIAGAILNYLQSFVEPLLPIYINSLIFVGTLIPSVCVVIAIHKNIPDLILITLLSNVMGIIMLLAAPFALPPLLPNLDDSSTQYWSPEQREILQKFLDRLLVACLIGAGVAVYFCIVIYSQFSVMKEEEKNRSNTNARDMPTINTIA